LLNELKIDGIDREREVEILRETFDARREWVIKCRPTYVDFVSKFPQLKDFNVHVSLPTVLHYFVYARARFSVSLINV
jgi:hypothetical protein